MMILGTQLKLLEATLKLVRSLSAGGLDGDMCVRVLQFSLDVFETIVSAHITSSCFFIAEQCGIVFLSLFIHSLHKHWVFNLGE